MTRVAVCILKKLIHPQIYLCQNCVNMEHNLVIAKIEERA